MNQELKDTISQIYSSVRNSIVGNSNEFLPVKYHPYFQWLKEMDEISKSPLYVIPPKEETAYVLKPNPMDNNNQYHSGIIEDLNSLLNTIQDDMEKTLHSQISSSHRETRMIQRDTVDFYKRRIPMYCNRIADHIQGLIRYDNYPQNVFADYNLLVKEFQTNMTDDEKLRVLEQLKILARSIIPFSVKYQDETVVEGSSLNPNSISEG